MATDSAIILDDGTFFIELNINYEASAAPGFLQRRCPTTITTPSGWECVGGFDKRHDGTWQADVSAPYDETSDSDCLIVGQQLDRMAAIVVLWRSRHLAFCRHN